MKKILFFILFCFIPMSFTCYEVKPSNLNKEEKVDTSFLQAEELNDSILYLALLYYEVAHPKTVLAQAKLESGNFTSNMFLKKNNFLGLYNSRKGEYFKFNHWTDCIEAYKTMIEYKLKEDENYYKFLTRIGYAENPNYIKHVKKIEKKLNVLNK